MGKLGEFKTYQSGTTLWGSEGWLRISGFRDRDGSRRSFQWSSVDPKAPHGAHTVDVPEDVDSYQLFIQAAIDSVRGVRESPLAGEECMHILETIFGAYRAADTGETQAVD